MAGGFLSNQWDNSGLVALRMTGRYDLSKKEEWKGDMISTALLSVQFFCFYSMATNFHWHLHLICTFVGVQIPRHVDHSKPPLRVALQAVDAFVKGDYARANKLLEQVWYLCFILDENNCKCNSSYCSATLIWLRKLFFYFYKFDFHLFFGIVIKKLLKLFFSKN